MLPKCRPTTPGEMLREEFLVPLKLTPIEFARRLGLSARRVNRILSGQSAVNSPVAWKLAEALGTSLGFWMTLQARVDLWDAGVRAEVRVDNRTTPTRLPTHRRPTTPGEILREEFLVPLKLSQIEFARRAGMDPRQVSRIVREQQAITAPIARKLNEVLGMTAMFWMNLQNDVDLWDARKTMPGKRAR